MLVVAGSAGVQFPFPHLLTRHLWTLQNADGRPRQRRDGDAPKSVHAKRLQAIPEYARRWVDGLIGWTGGLYLSSLLSVSRTTQSSSSPYRPSTHKSQYPNRLYQVLPISSGPPPDIDTIIRSLRDNPLPPRPPGGPPPQAYGRGGAAGAGTGGVGGGANDPRLGRKRGRYGRDGDSDSSDDEEERGPQGVGGDVFRARQHERMLKELQR